MHIYFSGIGGTAIGPLALIARRAGFDISGSDKQDSLYLDYLKKHDINNIHVGQSYEEIQKVHDEQPIDWFVYSSALSIENPNAPELQFCRDNNIKATKRDEFLNFLLKEKNQKLIAIAGTHGKTTTTAMAIWLFKQLDIPLSYSVGAKLSFGDMGEFNPESEYFIYEADEFDRNFLAFQPHISIITGIDWDHPDIYPTKASYDEAFQQFLAQSKQSILWHQDAKQLSLSSNSTQHIFDPEDPAIHASITLPGRVNRMDAWQVVQAAHILTGESFDRLVAAINTFPGVARRFEQIAPNLYSDYAHTPPKIKGALQLAHEVGGKNVVVVYEGLHNTRQHFIKEDLKDLFENVKQLYIVPSYLAREDPNLPLLSPSDLKQLMSPATQQRATASILDNQLMAAIQDHLAQNDLVLCITAGGGNSLDEWLRKNFAQET